MWSEMTSRPPQWLRRPPRPNYQENTRGGDLKDADFPDQNQPIYVVQCQEESVHHSSGYPSGYQLKTHLVPNLVPPKQELIESVCL